MTVSLIRLFHRKHKDNRLLYMPNSLPEMGVSWPVHCCLCLCAPANGTCNCVPLLSEQMHFAQQLENESAHTHAYAHKHTHTSMHTCVQACMCTQRFLIFCLQKLWILWGLYRLARFLSGFFSLLLQLAWIFFFPAFQNNILRCMPVSMRASFL